jgi:hypothetical protein
MKCMDKKDKVTILIQNKFKPTIYANKDSNLQEDQALEVLSFSSYHLVSCPVCLLQNLR